MVKTVTNAMKLDTLQENVQTKKRMEEEVRTFFFLQSNVNSCRSGQLKGHYYFGFHERTSSSSHTL